MAIYQLGSAKGPETLARLANKTDTGVAMIQAFTIKTGDEVRDTKLGLVWTVVAKDGEGGIYLRRNGVTASASIWDVKPLAPRRPKNLVSRSAPRRTGARA